MQLAESLQFVDGKFVAGQVQERVDQHRTVSVGQDETVTIRPFGIDRVMPHVIIPQNLGYVGHTHRRSRVSGIRLLHGVHAQSADGIRKFSARGHDVLLNIVDEYGTKNYPSESGGLSRYTPTVLSK